MQKYASYKALAHIPGEYGLPVLGNTLPLIIDTVGYGKRMQASYGNVYRNFAFGRQNITLTGADANEFVLFDKNKIFSSQWGWDNFIGKLFPRGLMLLDFEEHRLHRRAMSSAFKTAPMQNYLKVLDKIITARVEEWKGKGELLFYPAIKQLTLDLASQSFWGDDLGGRIGEVKVAFVDMIAAAVSPVRIPLPFTKMRKGIKGRAKIVEIFSQEVPKRRGNDADDIFSELCRATYEDGSLLSTSDIVDHMSFLLMAAHDTLTSSMSSLIYHLAKDKEWQGRLRDEVLALNLQPSQPFSYDMLDKLPLCEMAFKEAMRMFPPVPIIPRLAVKEFEFGGYKFPKNTLISISPMATHYLEEHWEEPDAFNPMRFSPENSRARHKYAWVPFSGGAHMCLGLHFAYMQAKCFMVHFLTHYDFSLLEGYEAKWQILPIPRPSQGLPITLWMRE